MCVSGLQLPPEGDSAASSRALYRKSMKAVLRSNAREKARFSTWYEIFPRFADRAKPPMHLKCHRVREEKNTSSAAEPGDVESPWAIVYETGRHTSIHPELGPKEHADDASLRGKQARKCGSGACITYGTSPAGQRPR